MDNTLRNENEPTLVNNPKKELAFFGNDPGAVKYGNFINYYSFHSPQSRLQNLIQDMFPMSDENSYVCLDIGCNSGDLSKALLGYLTELFPEKDIYILGIDIDPVLINRAIENNTMKNLCFENIDIMNKSCSGSLQAYLKKFNKVVFDITFCFSVTMWIHLNHGDEGLVHFISLIKENTKTIILEPQPWRCYKTAYRRMRRSNADFPLYKALKWRENVENVIEGIIIKNNFKKVAESLPSAWNRKIQSFHSHCYLNKN